MVDYGANLRRVMARQGLTQQEVVERTGLDERTIKGLLNGHNVKPHARTLHKLATGLGIDVDELFQNPGTLAHKTFDRQTNPVVDEVVQQHPELFEDWTEAEFGELYSRFGTGGALTEEGVMQAVHHMAQKREVHRQVELLLETGEAELLMQLVEALYKRVVVTDD